MTVPAALTEAQEEELEVLVGPDAWLFHQSLASGQVDVARAYRVHQDIRQVAAAVLLAAAIASERTAAGAGNGIKRMKDGSEEIEFFAAPSADATRASRWFALAEALQQQAATRQASNAFIPTMDAWGVE